MVLSLYTLATHLMMSPPCTAPQSTRDKQTLLPVTIKQLLAVSQSEPDDHFRIDGVELHQIKLVGQIVDVEETSTTRTYKIDDGTGVFSVRMFIEADENDYQVRRATTDMHTCTHTASFTCEV
jgi:replication factor A2